MPQWLSRGNLLTANGLIGRIEMMFFPKRENDPLILASIRQLNKISERGIFSKLRLLATDRITGYVVEDLKNEGKQCELDY